MNRIAIFAVACVISICAAAQAQQEKTSFTDLAQLVPKLVNLESQFESSPLPGITIEAREISRTGTSGKDLQVRYNIYIKGVPDDTVFRQIQWPVDREKPISGFNGITLNSQGELICAGRTPIQCRTSSQLDAPITFVFDKPLKGEPRRFEFIAPNIKIPLVIIPDPIQSEDKGYKLSAIRLSGKFEVAMIQGSGYPPNGEVHLQYAGNEKSEKITLKTDKTGFLQATTLHNTSNKQTGSATVEVTEPICHPKLTYNWGVF
jgi:hypothetical protein